ncbi:MAG TPA: type II toxin-antitoxin system VapC family toxin [Caulobacteraceae bacterium]
MIYLDTSVVVSVFVPDVHSHRVLTWLGRTSDAPVLSYWTIAEFSSAAALLERVGQITRDRRLLAEQNFDAWTTSVERAPVVRVDFEVARDLIRHGRAALRTPDALHLAVARRLGATLATLDAGMGTAALAAGLSLETI